MLHSSILTSRLSNSFVRSVTSTHTVSLSTVAKKKPVISSWPHEHEGNEISVNWSLTIDGIVPVGDAFRNARTALLTTRLPAKVSGGKVDIARPNYTGAYKVEEADDSSTVTHAIFEDWKAASDAHFSSGADLFIEDSGLGAHAGVRIGTRIITDIPAAAVIARTLMIQTPTRAVDHRARFNGWNLEEKWKNDEIEWVGDRFEVQTPQPLPGQRPVVVTYGGPGNQAAVQFSESNKKIVGANVLVGEAVPVRGLVDAMGLATTVVINSTYNDALAVASSTVVKGNKTVVIIGADESVVEAAAAKNILYGAYHSILTKTGVSAVWNGYIGASTAISTATDLPTVVNSGKAAIAINPNNMAHPAEEIVFFEAGKGKATITEDDAIARLMAMTDDTKKDAISMLVKGCKLSVAGNATDALIGF